MLYHSEHFLSLCIVFTLFELDKGHAVIAAENLKKEFLKLLVIVHRCVSGVDVTEIRLCISWFINSEKLNTSDILAHKSWKMPEQEWKFNIVSTPEVGSIRRHGVDA